MVTFSIIEPPVRNGGSRRQQLPAAVQHTDPVGAQHLMAGKRGEVDIERVEVDGLVRHRLAGVQDGQRAHGLGPGNQFAHRRQRAGHIGMVAECDDFDALVELQRVQVDAPVVSDAVPAQRGAGAAGQFLPGNQVGVVLELGGDNDVTGAPPPGRTDCRPADMTSG